MANTVQANVDVKINGDASSFEKSLKDLAKSFEEFGIDISKNISDPAKMTVESFKEMKNQIDALKSNAQSKLFAGEVDKSTFNEVNKELDNLTNSLKTAGFQWEAFNKIREDSNTQFKNIITELDNLDAKLKSGMNNPLAVTSDMLNYLAGQFKDLTVQASKLDTELLDTQNVTEYENKITSLGNSFGLLSNYIKLYNASIEDQKTEDFVSKLDAVNEEIQNVLNYNLNISNELIESLTSKVNDIKGYFDNFSGSIPTDKLESVNNSINNATEGLQKLSERLTPLTSLNINTEAFDAFYDMLEATHKEILKNIDDPLKIAQSDIVRLQSQFKELSYNLADAKSEVSADIFSDMIADLGKVKSLYEALLNNRREEAAVQELINENERQREAIEAKIAAWSKQVVEDYFTKTIITEKDLELFNKYIEKQEEFEKLLNEALKSKEDWHNVKSQQNIELSEDNLKTIREDFNLIKTDAGGAKDELTVFEKLLVGLASKLGFSSSEVVSFAKSLGASAAEAAVAGVAIGAVVAALKFFVDMVKKAQSDLINFGKGLIDAGVDGVDFLVDSLDTLIDTIGEALEEIEKLAEAGSKIQTAYYNINTTINSESGRDIANFTSKLQELYGLDASTLVQDLHEIISGANSLGASSEEMALATKNMTLMANDLSIFAGSFKKAAEDIGNAVAKGFVGRTSSLYGILSKSEKDELKKLSTEVERYNYLMERADRVRGRYIDYMQTEAGQVMQLRNQYSILINNINQLVLGLYAKIAPVLNELLKLANSALTALMKLFNINIADSANTGIAGAADKITEALNKTADAAEEAKKQIASFDDVIQIKEDKNNKTVKEELDDLADVDLAGIYNLDDALDGINDRWEHFRQLLEDKKWFDAGYELANQLADMMESIPWDKVQQKARETGKAIAEFLNGLNENERFWKDLGDTLAQALNTGTYALLEFAKTFNFRKFGEDLGLAWGQFWDSFDEDAFAETLYRFFTGVFELLGGFFASDPLTKTAGSIADILDAWFENVDQEDIDKMGQTIVDILDDAANAAVTLVKSAAKNTPKLISIIQDLLEDAKEWLKGDGKKELNEIGDKIVEILQEINDSGIIEDVGQLIRDFMTELHWGDIVAEFTELETRVWVQSVLTSMKNWWNVIKGVLKGLFSEQIDAAVEYDKATTLQGTADALNELYEAGLITKEQYKQRILEVADELGYTVQEAGNNLAVESKSAIDTAIDGVNKAIDESAKKIEDNDSLNNALENTADVKVLERRVRIAEDKVKDLSEVIKGLEESSKNLTEIIEELKNSEVIDDELKEFMDAITTNLSEAKDAWAEVVKGALDEMLKAYSDSLVEIEKVVNKEEELFEQLNTNVTTSIEDTTKQLDDFKTKIEKVLTETDSLKAGLTIMENLKKGLKQGWEDIRVWWNTSVAKNMDFSFKVGNASYTGGINIPRLATGGIVTGSTIANIGEYGREAVLPLDRNTGWMNTLADKLKNNSNNSNNSPVIIDMSSAVKPVYTRSEYLAMADIFAEAMKARGMVVSMEY